MHQLASDPVLVGAGDIADCNDDDRHRDRRVARSNRRNGVRRWRQRVSGRQRHRLTRIATSPRGGATNAARALFPAITTTTPPELRPITRISARTPVRRDGGTTATTSGPGTSLPSTATRALRPPPAPRRNSGCAPIWPPTARSARSPIGTIRVSARVSPERCAHAGYLAGALRLWRRRYPHRARSRLRGVQPSDSRRRARRQRHPAIRRRHRRHGAAGRSGLFNRTARPGTATRTVSCG